MRVCLWLTDEFREGRPKSAIVQKNIDAVRQLIKQYVTYREKCWHVVFG